MMRWDCETILCFVAGVPPLFGSAAGRKGRRGLIVVCPCRGWSEAAGKTWRSGRRWEMEGRWRDGIRSRWTTVERGRGILVVLEDFWICESSC